jgi:uncharacterized delta-60 repeat protein
LIGIGYSAGALERSASPAEAVALPTLLGSLTGVCVHTKRVLRNINRCRPGHALVEQLEARKLLSAAALAFTATPFAPIAGADFTPSITVAVEDSGGAVVSDDDSTVTLAIAAGPSGAVLRGQLSAAAVNGVATFANLSLNLTGAYTLTATDGSLNAVSTAITVFPQIKIGGLITQLGEGGLTSHNVGISSTCAVLPQPDLDCDIIGTVGATLPMSIGLTRDLAMTGQPDPAFGTNGLVETSISGDDQAAAAALVPSGDILVAGTSTTLVNGQPAGSQFLLLEYTAAGVLDPAFGGGKGYVLTSFSTAPGTLSNDVAHSMVVTSDGEIYVGGSSDAAGKGSDFAIAAYNPDGTPFTSFGIAGKVSLDISGGDDSIGGLALGPNGTLLSAGSATSPKTGKTSVALASFLPSGALDSHFGNKGTVLGGASSPFNTANSIAVTPQTGTIVVGGSTATGSAAAGTLSSNFLVLRFTATGKPDRTFHGGLGFVTTSFNQPAAITSIIIQSDGSILAAGKTTSSLSTIDPAALDLAIASYNVKGFLDTNFNHTGHEIVSLQAATSQSLASDMTPQQQSARLVPQDTTANLMQEFNQLIQSANGAAAIVDGGFLCQAGNSNGSTILAVVTVFGVDLAASLLSSLPTAILDGAKGSLTLRITDLGNATEAGPVTVQLYATSTSDIAGQTAFQSISEKLNLREGKAVTLHLSFTCPSSLSDGSYYIEANVNTGSVADINTINNVAGTTTPVNIAKPFIDLTGSGLAAPAFTGTKPHGISFTVANDGNIPTPNEPLSVQFLASADGTLTDAIPIATQAFRSNVKAQTSRPYKTKLALPATLPAGTYKLLVLLDPGDVFNDSNTSNNLIVSGSAFVVGM